VKVGHSTAKKENDKDNKPEKIFSLPSYLLNAHEPKGFFVCHKFSIKTYQASPQLYL